MAEESVELEQEGGAQKGGKKKLIIIIAIVLVLLVGGGVGAWLFLGGEDTADSSDAKDNQSAQTSEKVAEEAFYVAMPRPFLFNLPDASRSRIVEIKVQMMVRGEGDNVLIRKHIPLLEDALLTTFSGADVNKMSSSEGKDELRRLALVNVQNTLQPIIGRNVVEKVLFTGFVMQ